MEKQLCEREKNGEMKQQLLQMFDFPFSQLKKKWKDQALKAVGGDSKGFEAWCRGEFLVVLPGPPKRTWL